MKDCIPHNTASLLRTFDTTTRIQRKLTNFKYVKHQIIYYYRTNQEYDINATLNRTIMYQNLSVVNAED